MVFLVCSCRVSVLRVPSKAMHDHLPGYRLPRNGQEERSGAAVRWSYERVVQSRLYLNPEEPTFLRTYVRKS